MAKNQLVHKQSIAETEISIIEIPKGYSVNGTFRIVLVKGEEGFEDFTNRTDNLSVDIRNGILRKVANKLGLKVNFTE